MGRHSQALGPIREARKTVVFEQPDIQATRGLNTALQKTKHFVLRVGTSAHRRQSDTAFTKVGFSTWSKAMENNRGFKAHDSCSDHLLSMTRWESYKIQKENPGANIRNVLDPERQSLVKTIENT